MDTPVPAPLETHNVVAGAMLSIDGVNYKEISEISDALYNELTDNQQTDVCIWFLRQIE
jgi:hypothetical protein